jgi:hypothetical protein
MIIFFFIIILHSFIHFIPIQLSRAWTIRNKRRIVVWSFLCSFKGILVCQDHAVVVIVAVLSLKGRKALQTNGFWDYDLLMMMCKQMSLPRPTDWPHKLWILKWISKIKLQTIEQYSRRRRRRRRLYHLLQCLACMLSLAWYVHWSIGTCNMTLNFLFPMVTFLLWRVPK